MPTPRLLKGRPELAKLLSSRTVKNSDECKYIGLKKLTYLDPNGNEQEWDSAVRKTRTSNEIDGVGILAILKYHDKPDEILLQKQFRPPIEGVCIEMPAGLIDGDESIETAALRELKEETGYVGKVIEKSPIIFNDPGFTNTNLSLVTVEIDTTLPENMNPTPELEDSEFIECFKVPLENFFEKILELNTQGYKLDARVQHIAQGIQLAKQFNL